MEVVTIVSFFAGVLGGIGVCFFVLWWRRGWRHRTTDHQSPQDTPQSRLVTTLAFLRLESLEVDIADALSKRRPLRSGGASAVPAVLALALVMLVAVLALAIVLSIIALLSWILDRLGQPVGQVPLWLWIVGVIGTFAVFRLLSRIARAVGKQSDLLLATIGILSLIVLAIIALLSIAMASLRTWIFVRLEQPVGQVPLWLWIVGVIGTFAIFRLLPRIARAVGKQFSDVLNAALATIGILSLMGLAASWVPEWHWIPIWIRDDALMLRQLAYQQELVRQLTDGWDWERLRLAATVWIVLEGFGVWTAKSLPIPLASTVATVAVIGWTILQYAAVGGGQPVWAIEHLFGHLMDLAGFQPSDVEGLRQFARDHFRARNLDFQLLRLRAQGLLIGLAFVLALGSRIVLW